MADKFADQIEELYAAQWCTEGEKYGVWIDEVSVDQWWAVYIGCRHGSYDGVSDSLFDLPQAFMRAIIKAKAEH